MLIIFLKLEKKTKPTFVKEIIKTVRTNVRLVFSISYINCSRKKWVHGNFFLDADSFNLKTSRYLSFKLIRNSKKVVGECRLGEEEEGKEGQKVLHYNFLL